MPVLAPAFAYIGTAVGASAATAVSTGVIVAGTTASVVGTSISAYSSYQSGKAAERLHNYNADLASQQVADAERDGKIMANAQRDKNQKAAARQRALYAKSGVVGGTGSPLLVMAEQAGEMEMAALEIRAGANNRAMQLQSQAASDRMQGKDAARAGNLNAFATVLSGGGDIASMGSKIPRNSQVANVGASTRSIGSSYQGYTPSPNALYA